MRLSLPALFLPTLLIAQQVPDPFRFVPTDATMIARMRGLASLREEFANTRWWQVYEQVARDPLSLEVWREARKSFPDELPPAHADLLEALGPLLAAHRGDFVLGATILPPPPGVQQKEPDLVFSLRVAGTEAELGELERIAAGLLPEAAAESRIAGQSFRLHAVGKQQCSAPVRIDGALVVFFGKGLERGIEHCLTATAYRADPEFTKAPMAVQVELEPVLRLLQEPNVAAELPEWLPELIRSVDLAAIQHLRWTTFADGPWMAIDTRASLAREMPLLMSMCPPRTAPDLVTMLPATARTWATYSLDWAAMWSIAAKLLDQFAEHLPMTREEMLTEFTAATKLDLENDVIGQLGKQVLMIEDVTAVDEEMEDLDDAREASLMATVGNRCFVMQLRSGPTFAANLEKVLRSRGLHAARKSEEYGRSRIYRMTLLGMLPIEYSIVDDLLVLGVGDADSARTTLRGVLDAAHKPPAERNAAALPAAVAAVMQGWPEGWRTLEVNSSTQAFEQLTGALEFMRQLVAEAPEVADDMGGKDMFERLHALSEVVAKAIKAQGIDLQVEAAWLEAGNAVARCRM
jgi:hypothetical protein